MPVTLCAPGLLPVTLLMACLGEQHPANIGLTESKLAPCLASPNFVDQPGANQARWASRVGYFDFAANRARRAAIHQRFVALAGAPS